MEEVDLGGLPGAPAGRLRRRPPWDCRAAPLCGALEVVVVTCFEVVLFCRRRLGLGTAGVVLHAGDDMP